MADKERFFPATSMPDEDWWRMLWAEPQHVLKRLGLRGHMHAVDLCCGYGWFTLPMAQMLGKGMVTAIDIEPDMISAAKERLKAAAAPPVRWIVGCAQELDRALPSKSQDFVFIANTFHGVPDKMTLTTVVHKVLKTGGLFVIVNWHARPREKTCVLGKPRGPATDMRMSPQAVQEVVEKADFEFSTCVELPPYHYGLVFHRL